MQKIKVIHIDEIHVIVLSDPEDSYYLSIGSITRKAKGVKERREQQIAERNEGRVDERGISTEANAVVKDTGKADRKLVQQNQAVAGKDKKLSIHERLEINKRIIQEKQGKDKPERGADRGIR